MSDLLTVLQAAERLGCTTPAIYYHSTRRPELFEDGPLGKSITAENLEKLKVRKMHRVPPKRPKAPEPITPLKPSQASRRWPIGWYCKRCKDVMPLRDKLCSCMDTSETQKQIQRFRDVYWSQAYTELVITLGASP